MKNIILVILLLSSYPALAEWSKAYQIKYAMGDGDNRVSARQAAIEQIKLKASSEAGTYIQSTTTLNENGALTENIQMLSASMVKILVSGEQMAVNKSGQAVLMVKATATLDDSELAKHVQQLQQDKEKARQVRILQSENEALRKDYEHIRRALAGKLDQASTADLLSRQDTAIKHMESNGNALTQVFTRGTLLQMASRNSDAFADAKKLIDDQFFSALLKTPLTAEIESVEQNGDHYVALVRVGWKIQEKEVLSSLNRFLNTSGHGDKIIIDAAHNAKGAGPNVLSEQIYRYVASSSVQLKLDVAGKEVDLPVFFADGSFFGDCSMQVDDRSEHSYLCLVSQDKVKTKLFGVSRKNNPVRIELTRAEAERATMVKATFVRNYDKRSEN
jgi:regulator of replication initiation timing